MTLKAPAISPSVIKLMLTFNLFNSLIILSCLDRFKTQALISEIFFFFALASKLIFFSTLLSKSIKFFGRFDPITIFSMYVSGADNKPPFSEIAKTEKALDSPFAVNLVPSRGSTAISNSGPFKVPSFSPIYNIGASSISPSPITTVPFILILLSSLLIGSTAPLSAAILSFFPTNLDAPIAAFSVTLINKFKNLFSIDIKPRQF